jgi:hypothetical protein
MHRLIFALLLPGITAAAGCSRASPQFESRPTFPVQGSVLIEGKPAEGVQVFFHPRDASQGGIPRGVTGKDGCFHLRTYHDGDGAPAGEYTVTLYWPGPYQSKLAAEDQLPPDRLDERFLNPKNSPFRASVGASPSVIPPFEVQ